MGIPEHSDVSTSLFTLHGSKFGKSNPLQFAILLNLEEGAEKRPKIRLDVDSLNVMVCGCH